MTGATLNETFASGTTAYTADVANSVTSITVAPTATAGATYEITAAPSGVSITNPTSGAATLSGLVEGDTTITITVTAQTGLATDRTGYTLTITRAAPVLSTDATLRTLTVDGVPVTNPAASGTCIVATPCAVTIGSDLLATVVATPTNVAATITRVTGVQSDGSTSVGGDDADDYQHGAAGRRTVDLTDLTTGDNIFTILVTAEDATTTRTYTITATVIDPATSTILRWRDNGDEVPMGTALNLSTAAANFVSRSHDDGEGPLYLDLPDTVADVPTAN